MSAPRADGGSRPSTKGGLPAKIECGWPEDHRVTWSAPESLLTQEELQAFAQTSVLAGRLVTELARLRSDVWLAHAAEEIGRLETREGYVDTAKALAILLKHRDEQ